MMTRSRATVLNAEEVITEAAAELTTLQKRSAALAKATEALDEASANLVQVTALLRASQEIDRRTREELREAAEEFDFRIAKVVGAAMTTLAAHNEQSFFILQQKLIGSIKEQEDAIGDVLTSAKRSLFDSAQLLSSTTGSIVDNAKLLSDVSAGERERWRSAVAGSVNEARKQIEAAASTTTTASERMKSDSNDALTKLGAAAATLSSTSAELAELGLRLRGDASRVDVTLNETRSLRRLVIAAMSFQIAVSLFLLAFGSATSMRLLRQFGTAILRALSR